MSDPAPLRLVDVTVAHERTPVVRELSLVVEPHGVVSLTGASGSGKSTVLAVVAGIIPHSRAGTVSGRVLHHGRDVTHEAPWERSSWLGFLAQDPASSLCLTHVDDELALPLENAGVPREEIGPRVTAIAQRLGIEHLVGRRTSQLSGGEQQRVALAATLVSNPEVVLLDEPLSMLDPQAAVDVSSLLHQELRGEGPAAVIVEHRARELRDAGVAADTQVRLGDDNAQGAELWWVDQPQLSTERPPAADPDREVVLDRHLSDLRRNPEGPVILDEFSVRLRSASITALLGPNGSGKSTLLMALAGVLPGMTPDERVAMVFQRPENQFITNTVLDEVSFGTTRERARELLALVGLEGLEERSPHQLSLGQQRRLSVVAVAAQGDPVLLLDEPTFGLDDAGAAAVAELIVALRDEGRAILLATHDLSLAGRLADARLELTERPSLTRAAPPEKIPDSPLSRVSPMLKLGATLLTSLGLLFTLAFWPVLAVAGLATLAVPLLARVPLRRVVRFQLPIYWFAASTLIVNLASRGTWQAGLESGLALAARTLAIGGLACLFVLSTDAIRFVNSAHQQAGVPARHAYALLAGYRLLEVLPDEWRTIRAAHATRTRHLGSGRISWLKGFARSGFSLLVVSLRRGQQLSEALEARGLGRSPRTIWKPVRWGWRDMVFALVCLIAVGLAVWSVRWPS